ncbi:MAG: DNA-binding response regulator [Alphaproteobacteria bacterium CG_4_9_14_3_um_filter_47_13]|nr:MAG: DNA-binding response regulator [Alphaproteobacteria bacterium CG_4_9_14_3_um_filter_47_13]
MKIFVIDRDTLSTQLIRSKLEAMGHTLEEEIIKSNALERLEKEQFDTIFFDPAPLNNARPIVLGIRRAVRNYPYIILMSQDLDQEDAIRSGANDILAKPLDAAKLDGIIRNSERMIRLIRRIGDENEDFPSAGGVISKSAFNQLFLSSLDRADRYGERSFLVFIGIKNYKELVEMDGPHAASYAAAKLSQYLVRLRRQSDIIAQTGKSEYCLMLQRPQYETEPMEAANRFAEALGQFNDIATSDNSTVDIHVTLIDIPIGTKHVEHIIKYDKQGAVRVQG